MSPFFYLILISRLIKHWPLVFSEYHKVTRKRLLIFIKRARHDIFLCKKDGHLECKDLWKYTSTGIRKVSCFWLFPRTPYCLLCFQGLFCTRFLASRSFPRSSTTALLIAGAGKVCITEIIYYRGMEIPNMDSKDFLKRSKQNSFALLLKTFLILKLTFFAARSAKVIDMYRKQPMGPTRIAYYPPLAKFNILLQRLRYLGIYHDEHLVSLIFCNIWHFSKHLVFV